VTGSVNQHGEVQAIGGVNEKSEGFFESCQKRGLTGTQGVIIPARNRDHLMLRDDVIEAVKDQRFAVYAVETVEEVLELLTGLSPGARGADGHFPEASLYGLAEQRLAGMAGTIASWSRPALPDTQ